MKHSVIDMSIRQAYLKAPSESRKETSSLKNGFEELNKNEEFLLAVTSKGFGKRSSAYEYIRPRYFFSRRCLLPCPLDFGMLMMDVGDG